MFSGVPKLAAPKRQILSVRRTKPSSSETPAQRNKPLISNPKTRCSQAQTEAQTKTNKALNPAPKTPPHAANP
jgi:hypothetical protein